MRVSVGIKDLKHDLLKLSMNTLSGFFNRDFFLGAMYSCCIQLHEPCVYHDTYIFRRQSTFVAIRDVRACLPPPPRPNV